MTFLSQLDLILYGVRKELFMIEMFPFFLFIFAFPALLRVESSVAIRIYADIPLVEDIFVDFLFLFCENDDVS